MTLPQSRNGEVIYLCRASGEGTADVRLCKTVDDVVAFYNEMFGLPDDAVEDFKKDFADEDGHWCNDGFKESLYCAEFECWRVPASFAPSETADSKLLDFAEQKAATIYCSDGGHWVFVDERAKERRGILGASIRGCIDAAMKEAK